METEEHDEVPYQRLDDLDFNILIMGFKQLPFFKDDLYLGMQAMNVGIVDSVITQYEYSLWAEWIEIEKTPVETAMTVSAMSQMWIYGLYEVLRMWRDRRFQFLKLHKNGGIFSKLTDMPDDDTMNITIETRKNQLRRYKDDPSYRESIEEKWNQIEPVYRMTELFRMNLAKHCAPGKDSAMPRAPGYGRINRWCGSMDYELIDKDGYYITMNRRNIADALRQCIQKT
jgi:hypothetical protein